VQPLFKIHCDAAFHYHLNGLMSMKPSKNQEAILAVRQQYHPQK